jgi:hypothetical protein
MLCWRLSFKRTLLQASIMHPSATYLEFYTFLVTQAKTHGIAIRFKRSTRHAHKANFDSFRDGDNACDDDEDSVLDKVIAHMPVQFILFNSLIYYVIYMYIYFINLARFYVDMYSRLLRL